MNSMVGSTRSDKTCEESNLLILYVFVKYKVQSQPIVTVPLQVIRLKAPVEEDKSLTEEYLNCKFIANISQDWRLVRVNMQSIPSLLSPVARTVFASANTVPITMVHAIALTTNVSKRIWTFCHPNLQ